MRVASVVLISAVLAGCRGTAPILLFNGDGTSSSDVAAVETILRVADLSYSTVDSRDLRNTDWRKHKLLIVPGGNFEKIGNGLTAGSTQAIREAVRGGVNYLGICAGAFFAGASPYNGLNLTSGVRFDFYGEEMRGVRKAPVAIRMPNGASLDHYWEDGPQLSGWGDVAGRYPDGTPAIVQGRFGAGWVLLLGVHPEAPASWRGGMQFRNTAAEDNAYAGVLIRAALRGEPLPHF